MACAMGCILSPLYGCRAVKGGHVRRTDGAVVRSNCQRSDSYLCDKGMLFRLSRLEIAVNRKAGSDSGLRGCRNKCLFAKEEFTLWGFLFELEILSSFGMHILAFPTLSAKDAERVGHPIFMCDLEVHLEWGGPLARGIVVGKNAENSVA